MIGPHMITLIHPPDREDRTGDPIPGTGGEESVAGCFWQPRSTSEALGGRDTVTIDAWCAAPPTASVTATDKIRFEGVTYAINGRPALHHTPHGPHHYEIELTRVEGA